MQLPITAAALVTAASCLMAPQPSSVDQPREFGSVRWGRKLEPALASAAASKKPVMLLFQEVPG